MREKNKAKTMKEGEKKEKRRGRRWHELWRVRLAAVQRLAGWVGGWLVCLWTSQDTAVINIYPTTSGEKLFATPSSGPTKSSLPNKATLTGAAAAICRRQSYEHALHYYHYQHNV